MYKSILVATDGSDHSHRAVETAASLAARYEAKLTIAHCVLHGRLPPQLEHMAQVEHLGDEAPEERRRPVGEIPHAITIVRGERDRALINERMRFAIAERIVGEAARSARAAGAGEVSTELLDGDPVDALLDCAERVAADVIVTGSRGLSELKGLLMGSVSHKLCQLAPCTCVTVK